MTNRRNHVRKLSMLKSFSLNGLFVVMLMLVISSIAHAGV